MSQEPSDVIVSFPVPQRYLHVVVAALAEAMGQPSPRSSDERGSSYAEYPLLSWTGPDMERLSKELTNPTAKAVLDLTAAAPAQLISIRSVESAAGRSENQARADLAGFTKFVKRRFGRRNWPFNWEPSGPHGPFTHYSISEKIAAMWPKDGS